MIRDDRAGRGQTSAGAMTFPTWSAACHSRLRTGTEDHWLSGEAPTWSHADAATYRDWIEQAGLSVVA
jgi:hypothetical protein